MTSPQSPFDPAARAPRRSWPLARVLGADVYVHWTMALVPLALLTALAPDREPLDALAWTAVWSAAAAAVVWTHALAHLWAAGALAIGSGVVLLAPFGPLAHGAPPSASPRTEVRTALAGPASHAVWVLVAHAITLLLDPGTPLIGMLEAFIVVNGALAAANLLPFHPMDGGRALRGILTPRLGALRAEAWTASAGYGGGITLGLAGLTLLLGGQTQMTVWAVALIGIGMLTLSASQRALFAAQFQARAPRAPREPEVPRKPEILDDEALRRVIGNDEMRMSEPALESAEERRNRLQTRIDELLDRINEVGGMDGLTPAERRELSDASESLRGETAGG